MIHHVFTPNEPHYRSQIGGLRTIFSDTSWWSFIWVAQFKWTTTIELNYCKGALEKCLKCYNVNVCCVTRVFPSGGERKRFLPCQKHQPGALQLQNQWYLYSQWVVPHFWLFFLKCKPSCSVTGFIVVLSSSSVCEPVYFSWESMGLYKITSGDTTISSKHNIFAVWVLKSNSSREENSSYL